MKILVTGITGYGVFMEQSCNMRHVKTGASKLCITAEQGRYFLRLPCIKQISARDLWIYFKCILFRPQFYNWIRLPLWSVFCVGAGVCATASNCKIWASPSAVPGSGALQSKEENLRCRETVQHWFCNDITAGRPLRGAPLTSMGQCVWT